MSRLIVLLSVLGLYLTSPVLSLSKTQVTILKTLKKKRLKVNNHLTTKKKQEKQLSELIQLVTNTDSINLNENLRNVAELLKT
jgi:hypothetical protein